MFSIYLHLVQNHILISHQSYIIEFVYIIVFVTFYLSLLKLASNVQDNKINLTYCICIISVDILIKLIQNLVLINDDYDMMSTIYPIFFL
jgi:hypothetical protein